MGLFKKARFGSGKHGVSRGGGEEACPASRRRAIHLLAPLASRHLGRDSTHALDHTAEGFSTAPHVGDFTAAVQAAREIGDPFRRSWALQEIATSRANTRDFPFTLNSASGIGKTLYRFWAYRDIAVAQVKAGQIDAAMDTARCGEEPEDRDQAPAAIERNKEKHGAKRQAARTSRPGRMPHQARLSFHHFRSPAIFVVKIQNRLF